MASPAEMLDLGIVLAIMGAVLAASYLAPPIPTPAPLESDRGY